MKALVVFESIYGNTHAIADALAEGLGDAAAVPVQQAAGRSGEARLLVVGGPTHMHGLSTARSRQMAVAAAHEDGGTALEEGAGGESGLRQWLRELPRGEGAYAAAFDTRLDRSPWLTGVAARGIARRLRHRGYEVVGSESFLVEDPEGPLEDGELERAREWGAELARMLGAGGERPVQAGS